jgi:hypothetical protein
MEHLPKPAEFNQLLCPCTRICNGLFIYIFVIQAMKFLLKGVRRLHLRLSRITAPLLLSHILPNLFFGSLVILSSKSKEDPQEYEHSHNCKAKVQFRSNILGKRGKPQWEEMHFEKGYDCSSCEKYCTDFWFGLKRGRSPCNNSTNTEANRPEPRIESP